MFSPVVSNLLIWSAFATVSLALTFFLYGRSARRTRALRRRLYIRAVLDSQD